MFKLSQPVRVVSLLKKALVAGVLFYCGVTTFLLIRAKPQVILVGIDAYGTRLIEKADDSLLKIEKENFIKKFLYSFYNYDQDTFTKKASDSGDLMSRELWEKKKPELAKMATQFSGQVITQRSNIEELRQVDEFSYEADLAIFVKDKLKEVPFRLRVELKIKRNLRSGVNPYPYEVEVLNEQQMS